MDEILNIIHKTIYQFIDASDDDVLMSEKDRLLLKVNKAICNNLKALEQEPNLQPTCNQLATDCISRQALLNAISQKEYGHDYDENTDILGLKYVDIIKGMPSVEPEKCGDCVSRQAVLDLAERGRLVSNGSYKSVCDAINGLPSVEPEKCGDIGEISDGYHTFNQLYHQRAILFAAIVNQNKDISWKSYKHSDGKYCFDSNGEWFIVGVDTPEGSYTYHYSKEYWNYFECKELDCGKEWDGHTEEDVTRLLSLEQQPCGDCISRNAVLDLVADYDLSMGEVVRGIHDLPSITPQPERCGDCISRRAIIGKCEDTSEATSESGEMNTGFIMALDFIADYAKHMPSVKPERKPGKWIMEGNDNVNE